MASRSIALTIGVALRQEVDSAFGGVWLDPNQIIAAHGPPRPRDLR